MRQESRNHAGGRLGRLMAATVLSLGVIGAFGVVGASAAGDGAVLAKRLAATPADAVPKDKALLAYAIKRGGTVFAKNCASCHGANGKGRADEHTPDLTDNVWLWIGKDIDTFKMHPSDVEDTITYGIRTKNPKSRNADYMPPYSPAGRSLLPKKEAQELAEEERAVLSKAEIEDLVQFVLKLSHRPFDTAKAAAGKKLYFHKAGCFDCHDYDYVGDDTIGSANLTKPNTWLYGSDPQSIKYTIEMGHKGSSPAFEGKLSPADIRATALYVISIAGKKGANFEPDPYDK